MSFERAVNLRRLADENFDVLVIGGGITGAGCALDAASRGLRTALIERDDFASGTSSKSSKLIHGGLRYLQQHDFALVYEALHERERLRRLAPHLVHLLPFMLPILTASGASPSASAHRSARTLGTALWIYDLTGGWRSGKFHRRLTKAEALRHLPTLPDDRLVSAYLYFDASADDARLTLTVARTAAAHGAVVSNRVSAVGLLKDAHGQARGAVVEAGGQRFDVHSATVINATGVWTDDVRALDEGAHPQTIRPAKGIHITVSRGRIGNDIAVVIPVPEDRRSLFVIPSDDLAYIGTTDTDYDGPLENPPSTSADVDYLLQAVNRCLPVALTRHDVLGTWAGLRPLVRHLPVDRTSDLSRRHQIHQGPSAMISVTGGKLTTYRRMAAETIDHATQVLGFRSKSITDTVLLLGALGYSGADGHLDRRFGTEAADVERLIAERPELARPLVPGLPYIDAEAVWAVRREMATTLDDVLSRRTRARLLARDDSAAAAERVARLIAPELGWSEVEITRQCTAYRAGTESDRIEAGLPATTLRPSLDR